MLTYLSPEQLGLYSTVFSLTVHGTVYVYLNRNFFYYYLFSNTFFLGGFCPKNVCISSDSGYFQVEKSLLEWQEADILNAHSNIKTLSHSMGNGESERLELDLTHDFMLDAFQQSRHPLMIDLLHKEVSRSADKLLEEQITINFFRSNWRQYFLSKLYDESPYHAFEDLRCEMFGRVAYFFFKKELNFLENLIFRSNAFVNILKEIPSLNSLITGYYHFLSEFELFLFPGLDNFSALFAHVNDTVKNLFERLVCLKHFLFFAADRPFDLGAALSRKMTVLEEGLLLTKIDKINSILLGRDTSRNWLFPDDFLSRLSEPLSQVATYYCLRHSFIDLVIWDGFTYFRTPRFLPVNNPISCCEEGSLQNFLLMFDRFF